MLAIVSSSQKTLIAPNLHKFPVESCKHLYLYCKSIMQNDYVFAELLGFETIGVEIENPFGRDYNDLPLDMVISFVCGLQSLVPSISLLHVVIPLHFEKILRL